MTDALCRVLLVDDSPDDRANFRQMLLRGSSTRFQFTEAQLGDTALQIVRARQIEAPQSMPFDCILLDLNLPDMSALDVLAALCGGSDLPSCTVIVMTGWAGIDGTEGPRLIRAGAQDYIGKNWTTPESLTRTIENSMERFQLLVIRKTMLDTIVKSQLDLRASEARFKLAMDGSRLAMWDYDIVTATILFSETWSELLGGASIPITYAFEDFLGKIPPQELALLRSNLMTILAGKNENFFVEYRFPTIDGRLNWFAIQGRVTERDNSGVAGRMIGVSRDINERKSAEAAITHMAFYDELTDLPNRRFLVDRLNQALAAGRRNHWYSALLFIDLDKFKLINDTLGHAQGDLLLKQVAERLTFCVREVDVLARLGGDEFIVLIENLDSDPAAAAAKAAIAAEKIRLKLNQLYLINELDYEVTSSIGLTLFGGHLELCAEEIMQRADNAMFQAKDAGRNTVQFFDSDMNARVLARNKLGNELRSAISGDQLVLHYQPQVDIEWHLRGAEALVRWHHPTRGLMHPADFIPLAEETGLILPLGLWVMEDACNQLALWASVRHLDTLMIAVNVSAQQFRQASFVSDVLSVLRRTGARSERLKLELTEGILLENIDETIDKMSELREIGVTFSLDDFGTGYSSLSYLKRLPLAQLKIDQSFITDILVNPNDAAISNMVIMLAKNFGLEVIAEGVETRDQRDFLAMQGCLHYQGYFFGHPLPFDQFEELTFN